LYRIKGLAEAAKRGDIKPGGGWFARPPWYYTISTIYKLLIPLAVFRLLQMKVTFFDLDLIGYYKALYLLAKALYYTFSDDYELKGELKYSPPDIPTNEKIEDHEKSPEIYKKQGIYTAQIDDLAEALIVYEKFGEERIARLKTYNEFRDDYFEPDPDSDTYHIKTDLKVSIRNNIQNIVKLFNDFHPRTSPVLWRILLAQAHIYQTIITTREIPKSEFIFPPKTLKIMSSDEQKDYDWRNSQGDSMEESVIYRPFIAIEKYFKSRENLKDFLNS
jgi:hypothetical protein